MILPNYIFRRYLAAGGDRMPKLVPLPKVTLYRGNGNWKPIGLPKHRPCAHCGEQVPTYKINNLEQLQGEFRGGEYFHTDCFKLSNGKPRKRGDTGNLPNEEYRFWIGWPHATGVGAKCRCCGDMIYGNKERSLHLHDDKKRVNNMRCSELLAKAYTGLLKDKVACIVCHKDRYGYEKWGVPICDSADCEFIWRFDRAKEYIMLDIRLQNLRLTTDKSQLEEIKEKFAPPSSSLKYCREHGMWSDDSRHPSHVIKDSPSPREYCAPCNMFKDNAMHTEIHAERELWEGLQHNIDKD